MTFLWGMTIIYIGSLTLKSPQQNGVFERHHRHLIEIGLTLLHDANLSISYWPHAFHTAMYLINRQPTPLLQNKSPFKSFFWEKSPTI